MIPDLTVARAIYQSPLAPLAPPEARSNISPGARSRPIGWRRYLLVCVTACLLFDITACREQPETRAGGKTTITVIGFSILQEALEKEIFPAFEQEWMEKTGDKVVFASTFNGSEIATNQILHGFK